MNMDFERHPHKRLNNVTQKKLKYQFENTRYSNLIFYKQYFINMKSKSYFQEKVNFDIHKYNKTRKNEVTMK